MKRPRSTLLRSILNALLLQSAPGQSRRQIRKLRHEQLESRRVLTLPGALPFAEGDAASYNGPTVDLVADTLSFEAFIDFPGDVDSYYFAPQFTGTYTINVGDFGNTVDPEVAVYVASTGAQVGYNDDTSIFNDDARLVLNLVADVRYIIAVADQPATATGDVSLTIAAPFKTSSIALTLDPFGDAKTLVFLDVNTDIDYFSITAPTDATGSVTVSANNSTFSHRLVLFDASGTMVVPPSSSINFASAIPNQEYRIGVFPFNYASSGTLDLVVKFAESGAVVTNVLDSGPGSLRQAILDANVHPNDPGVADKIRFEIPGAGPHIITLASALPTIIDAVDIDGGSQAGTGVTPTVAIDGKALAGVIDGFTITANGTAIRKLNIRSFPGDGIEVRANSVLLESNTIGTDWGGVVGFGNANFGIRIQGGSSNRIESNVISSNGRSGIVIVGDAADNNSVKGNVVGARFSGNNALPNRENGILVIDADGNEINSNLISGNTLAGVVLSGSATSNKLTRNKIGIKFAGMAALPNGGDGVVIQSPGNQIGGNRPTLRNTISGNGKSGITISGAAASTNVVEGNFIGTNLSGTASIPNANDGVRVSNAANNRVGSATDAAARNVISGNGGSGITFLQSGSTGGLVFGNYIGTTSDGISALGNASHGVLINAGATNVQIGGSTATARNIISANGANGVMIASNSNNNRVSRNSIGINISGASHGNVSSGILIQSSGNTIGGSSVSFANTIAGNAQGITLSGADATDNAIAFNTIGTNTASNVGRGIQIANGASGNTIGPSNTIRRNESGIRVNDGSISNKITRNSIAENTNVGIDLFPAAGVTANDRADADVGANQLQNWPLISGSPLLMGVDLEIAFSVSSSPSNAAYPLTIEFYVSDGGGEGATFIASTLYTATNFAAGVKTVSFAGLGAGLTAGVSKVVGLATDFNGNSSEFSSQRNVTTGGARLSASVQQNGNSLDVNDDGVASAADALQLINFINSNGTVVGDGKLKSSESTTMYYDANGDKVVSLPDVLFVIQGVLRSRSTTQSLQVTGKLEGKDIWDAVLLDLVTEDWTEAKKSLSLIAGVR